MLKIRRGAKKSGEKCLFMGGNVLKEFVKSIRHPPATESRIRAEAGSRAPKHILKLRNY